MLKLPEKFQVTNSKTQVPSVFSWNFGLENWGLGLIKKQFKIFPLHSIK
jgi:hypothetical protein